MPSCDERLMTQNLQKRVTDWLTDRQTHLQEANRPKSGVFQTRTTRKQWKSWNRNNLLHIRSVCVQNTQRKKQHQHQMLTPYPIWLVKQILLNVHLRVTRWVEERRKADSVTTSNRLVLDCILCHMNSYKQNEVR